MTPYEIPLANDPQTLQIPLGGIVYTLTVQFNSIAGSWTLDIADAQRVPIVSGIPMVTGVDLLEQYAYLGIGGRLEVQSDGDVTAVPQFNDLGVTGRLFFVVE